jgi:hypothetical protein
VGARRFVKPTAVIAGTTQGFKEGLNEIFAPFDGVGQALGSPCGTVYVKPNGVHFSPHTYTDPRVLEAVLATLSDHGYAVGRRRHETPVQIAVLIQEWYNLQQTGGEG